MVFGSMTAPDVTSHYIQLWRHLCTQFCKPRCDLCLLFLSSGWQPGLCRRHHPLPSHSFHWPPTYTHQWLLTTCCIRDVANIDVGDSNLSTYPLMLGGPTTYDLSLITNPRLRVPEITGYSTPPLRSNPHLECVSTLRHLLRIHPPTTTTRSLTLRTTPPHLLLFLLIDTPHTLLRQWKSERTRKEDSQTWFSVTPALVLHHSRGTKRIGEGIWGEVK